MARPALFRQNCRRATLSSVDDFKTQAIVERLAAASFLPHWFSRPTHLDVLKKLRQLDSPIAPFEEVWNRNPKIRLGPPIRPEERLEKWRNPIMVSLSDHAEIFARILYCMPDDLLEPVGIRVADLLSGIMANIGVEASHGDMPLAHNLVVELRSDGTNIVGISPNLTTDSEGIWRNGTIQHTPAMDSEFDAVVSIGLLDIAYLILIHENPYPFYEEAARELRRVLKNGAPFIADSFSAHHEHPLIQAFVDAGFKFIPVHWDNGDIASRNDRNRVGLIFINQKPTDSPLPSSRDLLRRVA